MSMHLQHTSGSCTPTSASASILGFTLFHLVACDTCILETCVSLHSSLSFRGSFGNPSDKNHHYHIEPLNKLDASVRRYSYSCHAAGFEFFMFHTNSHGHLVKFLNTTRALTFHTDRTCGHVSQCYISWSCTWTIYADKTIYIYASMG